jgi:hypothetical protein
VITATQQNGNLIGRAIDVRLKPRIIPVIASDLRSGVEQLGDMIAEASVIVTFTGAGI